jgi:phosphohistidine phosphatase
MIDEGPLELVLWRHADAEDGAPDIRRALTKHGRKQASGVAQWLQDRLPKHYRMIVSPATRAQQTAAALAADFETDERVGVGAGARHVLAASGWGEASGTLVVVGHQPTLGKVAALLISGAEDDWSIKKGAIWWLSQRSRGDDRAVLRAVISPEMI